LETQKYRLLFSCCVHRKDVAGSRGRASGRGSGGKAPPEAYTFSFWTCNGSRKFACFFTPRALRF